jgi:hypothetical protein
MATRQRLDGIADQSGQSGSGGLFIPFSLIVRNIIVIGMIVAEPGEDIDQLEWCEKRR